MMIGYTLCIVSGLSVSGVEWYESLTRDEIGRLCFDIILYLEAHSLGQHSVVGWLAFANVRAKGTF